MHTSRSCNQKWSWNPGIVTKDVGLSHTVLIAVANTHPIPICFKLSLRKDIVAQWVKLLLGISISHV